MQQNRTTHLEQESRPLVGAWSVSSNLGMLLHALEAHEGMGAQGVTKHSRGGAYVDAVGVAGHRSHAIPPWPDPEAHEEKYWVANEALAIYFLAKVWNRCS